MGRFKNTREIIGGERGEGLKYLFIGFLFLYTKKRNVRLVDVGGWQIYVFIYSANEFRMTVVVVAPCSFVWRRIVVVVGGEDSNGAHHLHVCSHKSSTKSSSNIIHHYTYSIPCTARYIEYTHTQSNSRPSSSLSSSAFRCGRSLVCR